jgi:hypothetical protein
MTRIGVRLPAHFESAGEFLADAQALEAAGADLLLVGEGELDTRLLLAALAATTSRVSLYVPPDEGPAGKTLDLLCRGRLVSSLEGWSQVPYLGDRAAWRALLAENDQKETPGIVVDMDPRLLDLLRNPDPEDDRSDLQLAQG